MTCLAVTEVSHGYGSGAQRVLALNGLSLEVGPGEVVCIAGPSGSGKTALCHLAAGLESPDMGTVTLAGLPTAGIVDWSQVAIDTQQHGLLPELTVSENVYLPAYRAAADVLHLPSLLTSLDLTELADRVTAATSLGEQQRTSIARALSMSPRVLVLDEPTGHQDDEHVEQVLDVVLTATRSASAVLVCTHDDRVLDVADRVVRLDEGRTLGRLDISETPTSQLLSQTGPARDHLQPGPDRSCASE